MQSYSSLVQPSLQDVHEQLLVPGLNGSFMGFTFDEAALVNDEDLTGSRQDEETRSRQRLVHAEKKMMIMHP